MENANPIKGEIYAVGLSKGRIVLWVMINGGKWSIPTDDITLAQLAALGFKVINEF